MTNTVRPTRVEINKENIKNNLKYIRSIVGKTKIMGVVKANAYGHGMIEFSKELESFGIDYLGVAFIEEAVILRKEGIKTPILVLGALDIEQIDTFLEYDIDINGSSIEKLEAISRRAKALKKEANVHLKIDTGMGRIGVQWDRCQPFLKKAFNIDNINITGVFSHFASSSIEPQYTRKQLKRFNKVLDYIYKKYDKERNIIAHISNSGGVGNRNRGAFKDMVRTGLMIYGYSPIKEAQENLKPVMTFKTKVEYFKILKRGDYIGYDMTYKVKKESKILTLPVGYADGYARSLSNKAPVYIRGKRYPLVGRVCMDQMMVNIGMDDDMPNGLDVELWGENISLWELSNLSERSIYELLCSVSQRVPRVYL